jgi:glyoxylase-like metal-dependent hydrolase (beta-lactamase superfamily II)
MPMRLPMRIGRSMTVLRSGGELTLINSMRLGEEGLERLTALGPVAHVVRLGGFHGRDDGFYRDRFGAKVYAVVGQRYTRSMDPRADTAYLEPDVWLDEQSSLPFGNAKLKIFSTSKPPEAVCLIERDGGILVTGDSLQHSPKPDEYHSLLAKLAMKQMGFFRPYNVGPGWLRYAKPTAADVRSLLELDFEHVLPGHGEPVIGGAKDKFRAALQGELKGSRD